MITPADVQGDLPTFGSEDYDINGGQTRQTAEFAPEEFNHQQEGIYIERTQSRGPTEVPMEADNEPCLLATQYKEDTKSHLLKCLDEDLGFSKI